MILGGWPANLFRRRSTPRGEGELYFSLAKERQIYRAITNDGSSSSTTAAAAAAMSAAYEIGFRSNGSAEMIYCVVVRDEQPKRAERDPRRAAYYRRIAKSPRRRRGRTFLRRATASSLGKERDRWSVKNGSNYTSVLSAQLTAFAEAVRGNPWTMPSIQKAPAVGSCTTIPRNARSNAIDATLASIVLDGRSTYAPNSELTGVSDPER